MRKLLFLLFFFISSSESYSQNIITINSVNLRKSNEASAKILVTIPKNTVIYVDNCVNGWCSTIYNGVHGYISSKLITDKNANTYSTINNRDLQGKIKHYTNSAGQKIQSPTYYKTAPAGATAECRDGTYSFSTSRRGTCSHHGGVKKWL